MRRVTVGHPAEAAQRVHLRRAAGSGLSCLAGGRQRGRGLVHQARSGATAGLAGQCWAGLRSFGPDGELVGGFDVQAAGFFWLAGQGGYGIQSAEGSSRLARALLLGQPLTDDLKPIDLAALSPARLQR